MDYIISKEDLERYVEEYERYQLYSDTINAVLKILTESRITVSESSYILEQAKDAIKLSVQSTCFGDPLTDISVPNYANDRFPERLRDVVIAEVNRRKEIN